jgi:hypothetical protein
VYSLVYASKSLLPVGEAAAEIESIIEVATARNQAAGVTGALLYTGTRFAQLLEGEEASVLEIMASIARDPRHADVAILDQGGAVARRFCDWSLVYGHSTFAAGIVERALAARGAADGYALRNLIRLLRELAPPSAPGAA